MLWSVVFACTLCATSPLLRINVFQPPGSPSAVVTGVGTHTADYIVNLTVCSIAARPCRLNADRVPRPRLQDDLAAAKEALTTKPLQDLLGCAELNGK